MKAKLFFSWLLRIISAVILFQTLYFKFTGHPESIALFSKLGAEPWGRIGTGILELVAGILIILPRTVWVGALLGLGLIVGAIFSHLLIIGIESGDDGGLLFGLAIVVFICCALLLFIYKPQVIGFLNKLKRAKI